MNQVRSLNPALTKFIKLLPKLQHGNKHIVNKRACQDIIDRLSLHEKYPRPESLDIVDVFTGFGLFSTMINYELKPRNHVIIENGKANITEWTNRINHLKLETGNRENFVLYPHNGFNWSTYHNLIERDKLITPQPVDRTKVNDELLIIGNLTSSSFGESLLAQWIMCSVYRNWLQKYGRVRMLCMIPDETAAKFLSGKCYHKRNKSAIKRELFTDTKLVAVALEGDSPSGPDGCRFDPNCLFQDQPYRITNKSILPLGASLSVIEIVPKDLEVFDVDLLEYLLQTLMYRATSVVGDSLAHISPGADDALSPLIPKDILQKSPRDLTTDDIMLMFKHLNQWPFKPTAADMFDIMQDDSRVF